MNRLDTGEVSGSLNCPMWSYVFFSPVTSVTECNSEDEDTEANMVKSADNESKIAAKLLEGIVSAICEGTNLIS